MYLFCETEPVIESSGNLTFGPYNVSYPLQDQHMSACGLNPEENKWDLIFDFTGSNEAGEEEKHHKLIEPSEFSLVDKPVEGFTDPPVNPFPIPQRYGGSAPDNDLSQHHGDGTFDIKNISAAEAQKTYEEIQQKQEENESVEQVNTIESVQFDDQPQVTDQKVTIDSVQFDDSKLFSVLTSHIQILESRFHN